MAEAAPSARMSVLRSILLFSPFLVVVLVALAFLFRAAATEGMSGGRIVALVFVGFLAVLLAYQVIQSTRDLLSQPVETTGLVERRWSRSDVFIFRNSYIFVGRDVFRLSPEQFIEIDLGDMVRILHDPHTAAVETIEVVARGGESGGAGDG